MRVYPRRQTAGKMKETDKKIADLPSTKEISTALPLVRTMGGAAKIALKMGIGGEKARELVANADQLLGQADILELPDRFNTAFAERGWFATSSISIDVTRRALKKHADGDSDAAEELLLDWILNPETINLFAINRGKPFNDVTGRWHQLREALALTEEHRYWSAVPLILIACDGLASDVLGKSPFKQDADLSLFDSMVAHPTSLPAAIKQITKGVRKSSDDELTLPLRHGILHGRSLGYANRMTCGKAWMLMIALVDWATDKREEESRREQDAKRRSTSWSDIARSIQKNQTNKASIEAFEAISWAGPFGADFAENEPPLAFQEFLAGWQKRNFGLMAKRAVNFTQQSHAKVAGRMRLDTEHIHLDEFEILSIAQTSVARAEARVRMNGHGLKGEVGGEFLILAFRQTSEGNVAMPSDEGVWQVQQKCILDLMHERAIERSDSEK